jgi:hypothetical protein
MRSPLLSRALKDDALHLTGVLARALPAAAATGHQNPSLASGSASLFTRLYPLTAEQARADAARFWVVRTLELCSAPAREPRRRVSQHPAPRPPGRRHPARRRPPGCRLPPPARAPRPNPTGTSGCWSPRDRTSESSYDERPIQTSARHSVVWAFRARTSFLWAATAGGRRCPPTRFRTRRGRPSQPQPSTRVRSSEGDARILDPRHERGGNGPPGRGPSHGPAGRPAPLAHGADEPPVPMHHSQPDRSAMRMASTRFRAPNLVMMLDM